MEQHFTREVAERPESYLGLNLDPTGLTLQPQKLAPGVYALMANMVPKNNNGIIIGDMGVLVVDAGMNGAIARQIQQLVSHLTDKPLRYLVNTAYHGDHTFGNAAFPEQVITISSQRNKQSMHDLAYEKRMRLGNLRGNLGVVADVTTWRRPNITFEHACEIDLGNQLVQLWHFGPGDAAGDTIVYVPSARMAWTGNLLPRAGIAPLLLEGEAIPYMQTVQAMKATLDVQTIIPGHGPLGNGTEAQDALVTYLQETERQVQACFEADMTLEETLEAYPCPLSLVLPAQIPGAIAINSLNQQRHRLNVLAVYREKEGMSTFSSSAFLPPSHQRGPA